MKFGLKKGELFLPGLLGGLHKDKMTVFSSSKAPYGDLYGSHDEVKLWMSLECVRRPDSGNLCNEIMLDKGQEGGSCNVTHCQKPGSAHFYNHVMQAWYCHECATKIESSARRDGLSFYSDLPRINPELTRRR